MLNPNSVPYIIFELYQNYDYFIPLVPIPKPRMTRSDRWKKRNCVLKYFEYKDNLNSIVSSLNYTPKPTDFRLYFLPFPKSYSNRKKIKLSLTTHTLKPDLDNLDKAFFDCLFSNDSHLWFNHSCKLWQDYNNNNSPGIYIHSYYSYFKIISKYL